MKTLFAFLVALLLPAAAFAAPVSPPQPRATAMAQSQSASQSQSGALAGVNNNLTFTSPTQTTSTVNSTGTSANTLTYGGTITSNVNTNAGGTQTLKNVPPIYAPSLTSSMSEVCLGSASGGVAGPGFGVSLGKTVVDDGCERRLDASVMARLGMKEVAFNIMCEDPRVAKATKGTTNECPSVKAEQQKTAAGQHKYTDPIIRERLGLPPIPESEQAPQ